MSEKQADRIIDELRISVQEIKRGWRKCHSEIIDLHDRLDGVDERLDRIEKLLTNALAN